MKVYFYHTQDLQRIDKEWKAGQFPGHFLYGATHLERHGIDVVMHKHKNIQSRAHLMIYVAWRVLTCRQHIDAIYATHWDGLELIIFLRALHLYRHPVILWHHQPIMKADSSLREMVAQVFYRGIDHMFFFSEQLIQESLKSSKAREERMQVVHWGADLDYYDRIMAEHPVAEHKGFISTGKEKRDMPTLIRAFSATGHPLDIYIAYKACGDNYLEILGDLRPSANIRIQFIKGLIPHELAQKVWEAKFVAICCQETNYTVGLTTLVEALAFGMPVIATRNITFPFNIEKEGVGIIVPYYDSVAWEKAIRHLSTDEEAATRMGQNARRLAERLYNLDTCTAEVAEAIKSVCHKEEKAAPQPEGAAETPQAEAKPAAIEVEAKPAVVEAKSAVVEAKPIATQAGAKPTATQAEEKPAVVEEPIVIEKPIIAEEEPAIAEEEPATSSAPSLADQPIINVEALKYKLRHLSHSMQPLVEGMQAIAKNLQPATKRMLSHMPSRQQLMAYLPTRDEMADLWTKTKGLASRVGDRVKNIKKPK